MTHYPNVACNENCCDVKQELVSDDDNDQLIPSPAALWLSQGAEQEENFNLHPYQEELYAGHIVKQELVIGPEVLQQPDSVVKETGPPYLTILHLDVQDVKNEKIVKLDKEIGGSTTELKSECDKEKEVAIVETENRENDAVDVLVKRNEYEYVEINGMPLDTVPDTHIVESSNLLEDNTINCETNQALIFNCSQCKYHTVISESFQRHLRLHDTSRQFVCYSCGLRFNTKPILLSHINNCHSAAKKYSCNICQQKCANKSILQIHLRVHSKEKPYRCRYCNYRCSHRNTLKRHLSVHTGEKPYACTFCKYKCVRSSSLKEHIRIHTGEKPYSCEHCNYSCSNGSNLRKHLAIH